MHEVNFTTYKAANLAVFQHWVADETSTKAQHVWAQRTNSKELQLQQLLLQHCDLMQVCQHLWASFFSCMKCNTASLLWGSNNIVPKIGLTNSKSLTQSTFVLLSTCSVPWAQNDPSHSCTTFPRGLCFLAFSCVEGNSLFITFPEP